MVGAVSVTLDVPPLVMAPIPLSIEHDGIEIGAVSKLHVQVTVVATPESTAFGAAPKETSEGVSSIAIVVFPVANNGLGVPARLAGGRAACQDEPEHRRQ